MARSNIDRKLRDPAYRVEWTNTAPDGFAMTVRHPYETLDLALEAVDRIKAGGEANGATIQGTIWTREGIPLGTFDYKPGAPV